MICFCWLGFPQYGARCVRAFVRSTKEKVVVVATKPDVPVKGMEEIAECKVVWIDDDTTATLKELLGELPRVITVPGWRYKPFNRFRDEVRVAGGRAILASDNNFDLSWKTLLKAIFMRFYAHKYDGFWVPQESGRRLMRFYGVPDKKIHTGMYSVDGSLFSAGQPLRLRKKKILFVGRFNERKNILRLCEAFLLVDKQVRKGWKLEMCGCGPLKDRIPHDESIIVHDFVQPEQLAEIYRSARAFTIPSLEDHWPLVMHEAVLSGCVLLPSERCGDAVDFLAEGINGFSFSPVDVGQMATAMAKVMRMSDAELDLAHRKSLELGNRITLQTFVQSVNKFI